MPTHGYAHAKFEKIHVQFENSWVCRWYWYPFHFFYFCILASHNLSWWSMHIKSQTAGIIFMFLINSRDSLSFAMFCKAPVQPSAISIMLIPSWSFSSSVPTISRTAADRSFTRWEMISWFLKEKVHNWIESDRPTSKWTVIAFPRTILMTKRFQKWTFIQENYERRKTLYFGSNHDRPLWFLWLVKFSKRPFTFDPSHSVYFIPGTFQRLKSELSFLTNFVPGALIRVIPDKGHFRI